MTCRFAALCTVFMLVACTVGKPPTPPPVTTPPVMEAGAPDAGTPADASPVFGDAAIPGCATLCLRCPELAPDGGDCTMGCATVLYAVNGRLDAACVSNSADCDQAVRCIK
jgi:hypothetical protein